MLARLIDADVVLRAGRNRGVQALIGAAFVFYLVYHLTRFQFAQMWPIALLGDAAILFEASRDTFTRGAYPDGTFPYSPSAVILFRALGLPGPTIFMLGWYVLMAAGLVVSVRAALTQERAEIRAAWPLIGAIAVVLSQLADQLGPAQRQQQPGLPRARHGRIRTRGPPADARRRAGWIERLAQALQRPADGVADGERPAPDVLRGRSGDGGSLGRAASSPCSASMAHAGSTPGGVNRSRISADLTYHTALAANQRDRTAAGHAA